MEAFLNDNGLTCRVDFLGSGKFLENEMTEGKGKIVIIYFVFFTILQCSQRFFYRFLLFTV